MTEPADRRSLVASTLAVLALAASLHAGGSPLEQADPPPMAAQENVQRQTMSYEHSLSPGASVLLFEPFDDQGGTLELLEARVEATSAVCAIYTVTALTELPIAATLTLDATVGLEGSFASLDAFQVFPLFPGQPTMGIIFDIHDLEAELDPATVQGGTVPVIVSSAGLGVLQAGGAVSFDWMDFRGVGDVTVVYRYRPAP